MQKFWETLIWLWVHYSPWLVVSFLPSVVAGLMLSPKTQKAGTVVQKITDILKKLIELLSFVTFKDEPGTFQLPLRIYKPALKVGAEEEKKGPPVVPPATSILLIFALALPQPGCCKVFGVCGDVKGDVIDCASQAAIANAPHLMPIIKDILTGKTEGWTDRIWELIKEFGKDAVACAMQQVAQELLTSVPPGGGEITPEQQTALTGVQRARDFTAQQHWQFK